MELNKQIRILAINLLDNTNGVTDEIYESLRSLCKLSGNTDVIEATSYFAGRYFIGEDDAESLKQKH